jgi:hypothetical protein
MRFQRPVNTPTLFAALVLLGLPGSDLLAQDEGAPSLTGQWAVTIDSEMGAFQQNWNLIQSEDGLVTGSLDSPEIGPVDIGEGSVEGDIFKLDLMVNMQGQSVDISYRGTFTADDLTGTLSAMGGQFTAGVSGVREEGGGR